MINGKVAVHLRAPVLSASGYGVHARQIIDYLLSDERLIVFLENVPWGNCPFVHDYDFENKDRLKSYYGCIQNYEQAQAQKVQFDVSLQVTIPNEFSRRAQINIGVTAGIEVDRCTREWITKCNEMDIIVVPSTFSQKVLTQTVYQVEEKGQKRTERLERQVIVIPEWFEKPSGPLPDLKLTFPTKRNLLFVGLWGNKGGFGEDRKNVSDLIRLFLTHFGDNPDYGLVLKTSIITNSPEDLHHTKEKINQIKSNFKNVKAKIHLIHEHLSEPEMWSLYNHPQITGMVSLTHGEGWGLPLLEASAAGLPVLATNWSGHTDFLREKHGFLPLDFTMKEVPECQVWENVIDKGSKWASVDDEDVKRRVGKFLSSPGPIQKLAKENIDWLEASFSKSAVLKHWRNFFDSFVRSSEPLHEEEVFDERVAKAMQHQSVIDHAAETLREKCGIDKDSKKSKVLFLMPRSFGDIVIATSVVNSLINNRHMEDDFYFATSPQYKELADELVERYGVKVIDYDQQLMMNAEIVRSVFDFVYDPTINVQYVWSNWTLGNGEYGVRLLEEYLKACNLSPAEVCDYCIKPVKCTLPKKQYIAITPVTSKQSKDYKYWDDIIANLKRMGDLEVIQLGMKEEKLFDGCLDYRGKTFNETIYVVSRAVLHISPDTGTAHVAAAVKTPHIVLFGSTSPGQCSPVLFKDVKQVLIESSKTCEPRCYRDVCCKMKDGKNCLSQIDPDVVCDQAYQILQDINEGKVKLSVVRLDFDALDLKINEWHDSDTGKNLGEYLGMSDEEYTKFVERSGGVESL
jgi:glycosyltransferase involved in cell wall biosynthesis